MLQRLSGQGWIKILINRERSSSRGEEIENKMQQQLRKNENAVGHQGPSNKDPEQRDSSDGFETADRERLQLNHWIFRANGANQWTTEVCDRALFDWICFTKT